MNEGGAGNCPVFCMKAIQTEYKGYKFRSRLEARWAVFFDAMGLEWEYEPEGFDLEYKGWYLPDFYLNEVDAWIEIKPKGSDQSDLFWTLVAMIECDVCQNGKAWGLIGDPLDHKWVMPCLSAKDTCTYIDEFPRAAIQFEKNEDGVMALPGFSMSYVPDVGPRARVKDLIGNYEEKKKARQARFEHGENPWPT